MKKWIKRPKIFIFILLIILMMTSVTTVSAQTYSENNRLNNIIDELIEDGVLPSWHAEYKSYPYYHILFQKYYYATSASSMEYFASLSEERLHDLFNIYVESDEEALEILSNLSIPVTYLEPNQTVGLLFNGVYTKLIWTSEYIPNELLNLKKICIKDSSTEATYYNEELTGCTHISGDETFETITAFYDATNNIQLNITYIGGYHKCSIDNEVTRHGVDLHSGDIKVVSWEAELDHLQGGRTYDPTGQYNFSCNTEVTFNLSTDYSYLSSSSCQLICHRFVEITDIEAQSTYDLNFGGYKHFVYFNTNLDIDKIYRVDVGYDLRAVNEKWTAKLFNNTKDREVKKSLTAAKARGGLFNLFNYQGFTEGSYASNEKNNVTYQYKLHLNYDEGAWVWDTVFDDDHYEKDYTRVQNFKILRLNFLYQGEEFDVPIYMDSINGNTVSILDRETILDTSSVIWEFKDTTYDVIDEAKDVISDIKDVVTGDNTKVTTALKIVATCVASIAILYIGFKVYIVIKTLKRKE